VEGLLCLMADGLQAVRDQGVLINRVTLIGGGARSRAIQAIAPAILGVAVDVAEQGEYVATGAARQAAWTLGGTDEPPYWQVDSTTMTAEPTMAVLQRYRQQAERVADSFGPPSAQ
jgi:xylulokinase